MSDDSIAMNMSDPSLTPARPNSLAGGLGVSVRLWLETHITGSNMLRIFRHGVKLLGGEFLLSSGNAETGHQSRQELNELDPTSIYIQSLHRNLWWIFLTTAESLSKLTSAAFHSIVLYRHGTPLCLGIFCHCCGFIFKPCHGKH